jgi:hypothetical protein
VLTVADKVLQWLLCVAEAVLEEIRLLRNAWDFAFNHLCHFRQRSHSTCMAVLTLSEAENSRPDRDKTRDVRSKPLIDTAELLSQQISKRCFPSVPCLLQGLNRCSISVFA